MPSVAPIRLCGPILALCLPLILAGSWADAGVAATQGAAPVLIINRSDCRALDAHYSADDVSARFDEDEAAWRAVSAATPDAVRLAKLEDLAIDLTSELQQRLGLSADSVLVRPEAGVGNVIVKGDGIALVNGHRLSDAESYAIAALCRSPG